MFVKFVAFLQSRRKSKTARELFPFEEIKKTKQSYLQVKANKRRFVVRFWGFEKFQKVSLHIQATSCKLCMISDQRYEKFLLLLHLKRNRNKCLPIASSQQDRIRSLPSNAHVLRSNDSTSYSCHGQRIKENIKWNRNWSVPVVSLFAKHEFGFRSVGS